MIRTRKDNSRLGALDYMLMSVGSSLALYCGAMSVTMETLARQSVVGVCVGTAFSLLLRRLLANKKIIRIDALLYGICVVSAIVFATRLNALLPDGGFPRDVIAAAYLTWMILLGSFFSWRDGTLLFQAIPSIALFGLAGVYDTYAPTPFLFFGFLLCLATLFSRVRTREMLLQAVASGYFNRPDAPNAPSDFPEESPELFEDIKQGPWRWQAGPEWALLSALAVVGLSLVGAPFFQGTFKEVSGAIRVELPKMRRSANMPAVFKGSDSTVEVGRGPNTSLSNKRVLYEVGLDHLRYLRAAAYDVYTGKGWTTNQLHMHSSDAVSMMLHGPLATSLDAIKDPKREFTFSVTPSVPTYTVPTPAQPTSFENTSYIQLRADGTVQSYGTTIYDVRGSSVERASLEGITTAYRKATPDLKESLAVDKISPRVVTWARRESKAGKTDMDKALLLQQAIAHQCMYNLKAKATPDGADPVENFLFNSKEGYCDLFASSMVSTARSIGIPARYVVGFLPSPENGDGQGHFAVVESDYHAWAELFFEGAGWVTFDATEGANAVPGGEPGASTELKTFWNSGLFTTIVDLMIAAFAAGAFLLAWRGNILVKKHRTVRDEVMRTYTTFTRGITKATGTRRMPGTTPYEYMEQVRGDLNGAATEADRLTNEFVRVLFGPEPATEETLAKLRLDVTHFQKMARHEVKRSQST